MNPWVATSMCWAKAFPGYAGCTCPVCLAQAEPPTVRAPAKCECGAESAGCGPGHSSWCPKAVAS